jgi:ribosomal protein L37AE/L43A
MPGRAGRTDLATHRPPTCPRCGTNVNVRRGIPTLASGSWSCRWCLYIIARAATLTRELERELREAA